MKRELVGSRTPLCVREVEVALADSHAQESKVQESHAQGRATPYHLLIDCNNFFVSCERVFRPDLENKPVIVLSNNDGCIVSRSNEAKKLGIPMGAPLFKVKDIVERHKVHKFSANFELYNDLSHRVMNVLRSFTHNIQIYSIDEAFLEFDDIEYRMQIIKDSKISYKDHLEQKGIKIRATVKQYTSIPVSIGIAPTKTLCKIAGFLAKQNSANNNNIVGNNIVSNNPSGVFVISSEQERISALKDVPLAEVWGVGRQINTTLRYYGVNTAYDLTQLDDQIIRKKYGITLLRTVYELRGVSCLKVDNTYEPRKSIISSSSFGKKTDSREQLVCSIATHLSKAAKKLREDNLLAGFMSIFIRANRFKKDYYKGYEIVKLTNPTNDTRVLIKKAELVLDKMLESLYRNRKESDSKLLFDKTGIGLFGLVSDTQIQYSLFDDLLDTDSLEKNDDQTIQKKEQLFQKVDLINKKLGNHKLFFATCGTVETRLQFRKKTEDYSSDWRGKVNCRSRRYSTKFDELPDVERRAPARLLEDHI